MIITKTASCLFARLVPIIFVLVLTVCRLPFTSEEKPSAHITNPHDGDTLRDSDVLLKATVTNATSAGVGNDAGLWVVPIMNGKIVWNFYLGGLGYLHMSSIRVFAANGADTVWDSVSVVVDLSSKQINTVSPRMSASQRDGLNSEETQDSILRISFVDTQEDTMWPIPV